jgi:hypothetical protein
MDHTGGSLWKQNDLEYFILENTKKNPEEKSSKDLGKGHALTTISSSPNTWISDSWNRLLDPSIDRLFIEGSEKFDEGPLHAFQEKPATTSLPLPKANLREDSSCYMDHISDQISKYDLEVHEHVITNPNLRPQWEQHTQQVIEDLVGEPIDPRRTRSQFEGVLHALTTTEPLLPMHLYMVLAYDPQSYAEVAGNHYWEDAMNKEYNSLIENHSWDLDPLPSNQSKWIAKGFSLVHSLHQIHTNIYIFIKTFIEEKFAALWGLLGLKDITA